MARPKGSKDKKKQKPTKRVHRQIFKNVAKTCHSLTIRQMMKMTGLSRSSIKRIMQKSGTTRDRKSPQAIPELSPEKLQTLINRVKEEGGCWIVPRDETMYKGKYYKISRLFYSRHRQTNIDGLFIEHTCGHTNCINPDHMIAVPWAKWGTKNDIKWAMPEKESGKEK